MVKHFTRKRSRSKRGGSSYIPSAWDYVQNAVGNGQTQFQNSLEIQPGEGIAERHSNVIEPVGNLNYMFKTSGGRRRRRRKASSRRRRRRSGKRGGGAWTNTLNQAVVPFSLWGMQYYSKSKKNPYKSSSRRKRSRRRTYKR